MHCCVFFLHVCSSAAAYTITLAPEDITVCHQVMNMTVLSSTPSAVVSETICCSWQAQINSFPRYSLSWRAGQQVFQQSSLQRSEPVWRREGKESREEGEREGRRKRQKRGGEKDKREAERAEVSLNWESITEARVERPLSVSRKHTEMCSSAEAL